MFETIQKVPGDPILGLTTAFKASKNPDKVNLGVGSYKDEQGMPYLFSTVLEAEKKILGRDKEYLPLGGDIDFTEAIGSLVFQDHMDKESVSIGLVQSLGGTGALRLAGDFLKSFGCHTLLLSDPSWPNHKAIFQTSGLNLVYYPYLSQVGFDQLKDYLEKQEDHACLLLHGCCHNPTGIDFSKEEWMELSELCFKKKFFPFFDLAYQGFGEGLKEDVWAINYFIEKGHEMFVSISCSKNFGLYGERIGALAVIAKEKNFLDAVLSQIKRIARSSYSTPAIHGARIVAEILLNREMRMNWEKELEEMKKRIQSVRESLSSIFLDKGYDLSSIKEQKGLFSQLPFSKEQVELVKEQKAIFFPLSGRINLAGINTHNIDYVAHAFLDVLVRK